MAGYFYRFSSGDLWQLRADQLLDGEASIAWHVSNTGVGGAVEEHMR